VLPHAFLLFESMFAEALQARRDIVSFVQRHIASRAESSTVVPLRVV
jgi:hypothetical protein